MVRRHRGRPTARAAGLLCALALVAAACGGDEGAGGDGGTAGDGDGGGGGSPTETAETETAGGETTAEASETETMASPAGDSPDDGGGSPTTDFPTREITMTIPFPAGSANDTAYRQLSKLAEEELGTSIVIQNRVGGAGTVGLTEIANAEANGYQIGQTPSAPLTMLPLLQDTGYEGPSDFMPIIQSHTVPLPVFVNADSDLESLNDFVQRAQNEPGSIQVGVPCRQCILELDLAMMMNDIDGELSYVSMAAGEQATAVLNGSVDAGIGFPNLVSQYVESGEMRNLFYFSPVEVPGAEAPVVSEQEVSDAAVVPSIYALGPTGIPDARIQVLQDAYETAVKSEEFSSYLENQGMVLDYAGSQESMENLQSQRESVQEPMRDLGWIE